MIGGSGVRSAPGTGAGAAGAAATLGFKRKRAASRAAAAVDSGHASSCSCPRRRPGPQMQPGRVGEESGRRGIARIAAGSGAAGACDGGAAPARGTKSLRCESAGAATLSAVHAAKRRTEGMCCCGWAGAAIVASPADFAIRSDCTLLSLKRQMTRAPIPRRVAEPSRLETRYPRGDVRSPW
jgi:hypothetical protein